MGLNNRYTDQSKNAFQKSNLFYTKSPFIGIQDPTVFGFKLFFLFDNPFSPLLYGLNGDYEKAPVNSAAYYLSSIGDQQRLYYLKKFIDLLSGINSQTPWYFQSISGLKDAWKHDMSKPYIGADKKLEIQCLESIDLRVTALMDYYRKACFDWKNRREVIPKNLRQFKMVVYVYEARYIQNPNSISLLDDVPDVQFGYGKKGGDASISAANLTNRLTGPDETLNDPPTNNVNVTLGVPMSTTRNIFTFDFCEFDVSEPGHLDTISNAEPAVVNQKFTIKYEDVEEINKYQYWDRNFVSDGILISLDKLALDDPNPGEPPTQEQTPPITKANTTEPSGDSAEIQSLGEVRKNRLVNGDNNIGEPNAFPGATEGNSNQNEVGAPPTENIGNQSFSLANRLSARATGGLLDRLGQEGASLVNDLKDQFNADNLFDRIENEIRDAIGTEITSLYLGNVFNFSPADLTRIRLLDSAIGAVNSSTPASSIVGSSVASGNLDEGSASLDNTLGEPSGNALDEGIEPTGSKAGNNIYE